MKNILVPVDFSDTSAAALRFGTYLAEVMDLNLRIVHVYDANFSFAQAVSTGALLAEKERLERKLSLFTQQNAYPILATFQGNLDTLPALLTEVFEGFPVQVIRKLSELEETELVVMGGIGAGERNHAPGIFGGVARGMGLHGGCPVILLPPNYGYPKVDRLAVAFGDLEDIRQLEHITNRLIRVLRPEVRFVHVTRSKGNREKYSGEVIKQALGSGFPTNSFLYDALPPGTVARRLLDYTRREKIGLLVLGHQGQGVWDSLFSISRAKPVIRRCEVPLLVITTSGGGDDMLDDVIDGISSASEIYNAERDIQRAVIWAKYALGFVPMDLREELEIPSKTQAENISSGID